ncbi:hypothetical protein HanRHA438_Chr15g0695531 [Helianthus annuus]|nr:hypothetical protein HanRHA438_Chr15g0695531 [Helianthus annuus]
MVTRSDDHPNGLTSDRLAIRSDCHPIGLPSDTWYFASFYAPLIIYAIVNCSDKYLSTLPSIQESLYLLNTICEYTRSLFCFKHFWCYIRYLYSNHINHTT